MSERTVVLSATSTTSAEGGRCAIRLRIAITVDPEIPVPPVLYGGIERIVDMLVRGLVHRGHEVTLFANPESQVPCRLLPYPRLRSQSKTDTLANMWHVSSAILRGSFDVVHSFARLAYLAPLLPRAIPKIMSYGRCITSRSISLGNLLSLGSLHFTGCSEYLIQRWFGRSNFHVIYNGVPLSCSPTDRVNVDAPLAFLGRLEHFKGPHVAIEVAQRTGRQLVIAGNVPSGAVHKKYFDEYIRPHVDGKQIEYIGPVNDEQKNDLLPRSAALLFPLLGEEAFGIVMAEALACGTPVIAFKRGPTPEIVQHGVNGFVCGSVEEMVAAVGRLPEIDRRDCRRIAEEKFSDRVIVEAYERLYREVVKGRETA
jgi:glycosyltransferase involved in cell wall biosynthesis